MANILNIIGCGIWYYINNILFPRQFTTPLSKIICPLGLNFKLGDKWCWNVFLEGCIFHHFSKKLSFLHVILNIGSSNVNVWFCMCILYYSFSREVSKIHITSRFQCATNITSLSSFLKLRCCFEKCDPRHTISWFTGSFLVPEKKWWNNYFHVFYEFEMYDWSNCLNATKPPTKLLIRNTSCV